MPGGRILAAESGPTGAPYSYEVPASQVIEPWSVSAVFDGAGASDAFLPALAFYAQSGELLGRTFPGSPVAAGDSAEVTFAPFLRDIPGLVGAVGLSTQKRTGSNVHIPSGVLTSLVWPITVNDGLPLTTPDNITFTLPQIGPKPIFHIDAEFRWTNPVAPTLPFEIVNLGPAVQRTSWGVVSLPISGAIGTINNGIQTDDNSLIAQVYQDSGVDLVLQRGLWNFTYMGQYGGSN